MSPQRIAKSWKALPPTTPSSSPNDEQAQDSSDEDTTTSDQSEQAESSNSDVQKAYSALTSSDENDYDCTNVNGYIISHANPQVEHEDVKCGSIAKETASAKPIQVEEEVSSMENPDDDIFDEK